VRREAIMRDSTGPILLEVSCIRCEQLHRAGHPLEFNPLCPRCEERSERYAPCARAAFEGARRDFRGHGGSNGLDDRRHPAAAPSSSWECPVHDR
jgi:hypothetical protein